MSIQNRIYQNRIRQPNPTGINTDLDLKNLNMVDPRDGAYTNCVRNCMIKSGCMGEFAWWKILLYISLGYCPGAWASCSAICGIESVTKSSSDSPTKPPTPPPTIQSPKR